MIKCAVLGSPISHSLSPRLHLAAYNFLGIEGSYEALEMPEANFSEFFSNARENGWTGFSLTMPLKERINTEGIEIDSVARRINSVNTLYWQSGTWQGTSTDYSGFKRIFDELEYSSVCIIGGGATARAAIAALDGTAAEISIALRNPSKFDQVSGIASASRLILAPLIADFSRFDLVVSTVPAGGTDNLTEMPSAPHGTFFDVLYNPWPTKLAQVWHQQGGRVLNGFDLLVEQALDQISLMTGRTLDLIEMRGILNQAIEVERARSAF